MAITTDTIEKLTNPEKSAGNLVSEIQLPEITTGTPKQIQYAKDLRERFIAKVTDPDYIANVRWASIKGERGERLSNIDVTRLAEDAWNRRTVNVIETSDAKKIIDWFVANDRRKNDSITRYEHIIANPRKWNFNGEAWKRIDYK